MRLLQLSSAQGPAECELAVTKALRFLEAEAEREGVLLSVVEQADGEHRGTASSALVVLEGERSESLAGRWNGSLLDMPKSLPAPVWQKELVFWRKSICAACVNLLRIHTLRIRAGLRARRSACEQDGLCRSGYSCAERAFGQGAKRAQPACQQAPGNGID